jgi:hypothetical protein
MIRRFVGDDLAEMLAVPPAGPLQPLFRTANLAATAVGLTQQQSWVLRQAAAAVSRALLQSYATFDRGGDRPDFDIPRTLQGMKEPGIARRLLKRVGLP